MEKIRAKLEETLLSRKFWGTVGIIIMVIVEDHGLVSSGAAMKIQVALGAYVGGLAITEHGKEKAKIELEKAKIEAVNGKPSE